MIHFLLILLFSHNVFSQEFVDADSKIKNTNYVVVNEKFIFDVNFKGNRKIANFASAKKILKKFNFFGIKEELYCGCSFEKNSITKENSCGILPRKNLKRAMRIEFEHIVPFENQVGHTSVWDIGNNLCNGQKGRKCASKIFGHLEGDLWNLWPAAGELNGDRSNYSFSPMVVNKKEYGKCEFSIEDKKVSTRNSIKALIAYTYIYFQKTYSKYLKNNFISNKNEKMFLAWTKFPLTKEQCNWANQVYFFQGNKNEDLLSACQNQFKN